MDCNNTFWINAKARLEKNLVASGAGNTLKSKEHQPPWRWAENWPVARLMHSRTKTGLFVLEATSGHSPAVEASHSSVISGCSDTHFEFFREVQLKDELLLQNEEGHWLHYSVDKIDTVHSEEEPLCFPKDESRLVLITCHPFDGWVPGGPLRHVVQAQLVSNSNII